MVVERPGETSEDLEFLRAVVEIITQKYPAERLPVMLARCVLQKLRYQMVYLPEEREAQISAILAEVGV